MMTMPVRIFCLFVLTCSQLPNVLAQDHLPEFSATDLNGKEVFFMKDLSGRKALVGFAFSNAVQEDLQTWIEPVFYEMIDTNSLGSMVYDNEVYLVICFNKANASFREKVRSELIENVLPECYGNVVLTGADAVELSRMLKVGDKGVPHLYAVDRDGKIRHHSSGRYSERKFDELSSYLEID